MSPYIDHIYINIGDLFYIYIEVRLHPHFFRPQKCAQVVPRDASNWGKETQEPGQPRLFTFGRRWGLESLVLNWIIVKKEKARNCHSRPSSHRNG